MDNNNNKLCEEDNNKLREEDNNKFRKEENKENNLIQYVFLEDKSVLDIILHISGIADRILLYKSIFKKDGTKKNQ